MRENRCSKWGFYFIKQQRKFDYIYGCPTAIQTRRISRKNYWRLLPFLHKKSRHNLRSENSTSLSLYVSLCRVSLTSSHHQSLMKLLCLPLMRKSSLRHSGTSARPLDLRTKFSPANWIVNLKQLHSPLCYLTGNNSTLLLLPLRNWKTSSRLTVPTPHSLLRSLALRQLTATTLEVDLPRKSNYSSVFSITTSISSYNPLLEHQRPRLNLNQWLGSSWNWSVWVSRWFTPWLN